MSQIETYKAIKPGAFEKIAELNNNCFTLRIKAKFVKMTEDEKVFDKENIISGRNVEIKNEVRRAGQVRDLSAEYKRLKYSDKAQKDFESQMDDFAIDIREKIVSGVTTKRDGIDACLLQKKYNHKLIMYVTLSYYSTVYERRVVLENEKRL